MNERLNFAIQKSGRLHDDSLKILKNCGIGIENGYDQLKASSMDYPIDALYLRNSNIPHYVEDGIADLAIIGKNIIVEKQANLDVILKLGFSKCRLSIAIPKNQEFDSIEFLNGKRIATSYPNTLKTFLKENNIKADVHEISGSVEIAPTIGLADVICDLVSSGSTLFKNGLKEVYTILNSEACLVVNKNLSIEKKEQIDQLAFRMKSVLAANKNKYILLNAPKSSLELIKEILPGMKSPTIVPLAHNDWYSVQSVITENDFWNSIQSLKDAGAEGILILNIEKMIN